MPSFGRYEVCARVLEDVIAPRVIQPPAGAADTDANGSPDLEQ
jgi:hypothetical protein